MNLYQLTAEARAIQAIEEAHYADTDGELDEAFEDSLSDWLEQHESSAEDKLTGYGMILRQTEAEIDAIDAEIKRLQSLKGPKLSKVTRMKNAALGYLAVTGQKKIATPLFTFSRVGNGGKAPLDLDVADPNEVPERFRKVHVAIDNAAIREALEKGEELDFARFAPKGEHIRIR